MFLLQLFLAAFVSSLSRSPAMKLMLGEEYLPQKMYLDACHISFMVGDLEKEDTKAAKKAARETFYE